MNHWTSPERMIANFEEAVATGNTGSASSYLHADSGSLTTEYVENLLGYINDDPYIGVTE
ncbi:hypothetical protein ACFO4L_09755 [Bacillus daqingensis]|uniref:Uncharacterized protein n=1 Tax=Bacillus daqingensis TaxID=872396 RepID=A0ABV9NTY6_9BACI